jgi:hypothetical protein
LDTLSAKEYGAYWELHLWFPIDQACQAVQALLDSPAFSDYWAFPDGQPDLPTMARDILERIGRPGDEVAVLFVGRTRRHQLAVRCDIWGDTMRPGRSEPPADIWQSLYMQFSIAQQWFEEFFADAYAASPASVVFPVFREIAETLLLRASADIAVYCWEDLDLDRKLVESSLLCQPDVGVILRKDHPHAKEPGGVSFLDEYVLFENIASSSNPGNLH